MDPRFRSLGGWTPDPRDQYKALEAAWDSGSATELENLGVPNAVGLPSQIQALSASLPSARRPEVLEVLAASPDPSSALAGMYQLFEQPGTGSDGIRGIDVSPEALWIFCTLASQSAFLGRHLAQNVADLQLLSGSESLVVRASGREMLADALRMLRDHLHQLSDDHLPYAVALRNKRRFELARIFYREVTGLGSIDRTCAEVADLAAALINSAYRAAKAISRSEGGAGDLAMSVIGFGKLGARELNFSSDVDILFVTSGRVFSDENAAKLGQTVALRTAELLDAPLANGRVFRVDLRLRPDGSRGPLLAYPKGLRDYYAHVAQTWERAALLRARVVAGEPGPGERALELLAPVRYPKHPGPNVVAALRSMKDRIDRHESWRGAKTRLKRGWDVKVGQGGIREVEFIVSTFQILLAGREEQLREVSTFEGIGRLAGMGILHPSDADQLVHAYRFYRLVEHRLQMDEDRQTHRVPTGPSQRHRLGRRLGFVDWSALDARLSEHRGRVREIFDRLLASDHPASSHPVKRGGDEVLDIFNAVAHERIDKDEALQALTEHGFMRPKSALGQLNVLRRRPTGPFSVQSLENAERFAGFLLESVLNAPDVDAAMSHLTDLLTHPSGGAVVDFLKAKPALLRSVMTLLGSSDFLALRLVRNPHWIERILAHDLPVLGTRARLDEGWRQALARINRRRESTANLEQRLNLLRHFQSQQIVGLAIEYLEGVIDDELLGRRLSRLAELCLERVLDEARADLGLLAPGFSIVALGRLGSRELGFGSDLDLIFVYDGPIQDAATYARLATRLIRFIDTPLINGLLYEIDVDLRPHGNRGMVVTSLNALERYYREQALPFEWVALLRGRVIVGPDSVRRTLGVLKREILVRLRDNSGSARRELDRVRQRLLSEVARPATGTFHLKYGIGAVLEIELTAQVCRTPEPVTDDSRSEDDERRSGEPGESLADLVDRLPTSAQLSADDRESLGVAYRLYRRLQNILRLTLNRSVSTLHPGDASLRRFFALLGHLEPEVSTPEQLTSVLEGHMAKVASVYIRIVQ